MPAMRQANYAVGIRAQVTYRGVPPTLGDNRRQDVSSCLQHRGSLAARCREEREVNPIVLSLYGRGLGCLKDCKRAIKRCGHDEALAEGWLKYKDRAINVRPREGQSRQQAKDEWTMTTAKEWKANASISGGTPSAQVTDSVCDHNEMTANDDPSFAWKCAKCGYVYGRPNEPLEDLLAAVKEFVRAYDNPGDCDDINDTMAELLIEGRIYFAANAAPSRS